jgi:hypothetical protein
MNAVERLRRSTAFIFWKGKKVAEWANAEHRDESFLEGKRNWRFKNVG